MVLRLNLPWHSITLYIENKESQNLITTILLRRISLLILFGMILGIPLPVTATRTESELKTFSIGAPATALTKSVWQAFKYNATPLGPWDW